MSLCSAELDKGKRVVWVKDNTAFKKYTISFGNNEKLPLISPKWAAKVRLKRSWQRQVIPKTATEPCLWCFQMSLDRSICPIFKKWMTLWELHLAANSGSYLGWSLKSAILGCVRLLREYKKKKKEMKCLSMRCYDTDNAGKKCMKEYLVHL